MPNLRSLYVVTGLNHRRPGSRRYVLPVVYSNLNAAYRQANRLCVRHPHIAYGVQDVAQAGRQYRNYPGMYADLPDNVRQLLIDEYRAEADELNALIDSGDYINDDCPANCNRPHETPSAYDCDAQFTCPATEVEFIYCTDCGWEERSRYSDDPTYIGGEWYCDPREHGYLTCDSCGEWGYEDDMLWDGDSDDCYCHSCYRDVRSERTAPQRRTVAPCCDTHTDYFHEDNERFVCKCQADAAVARREPVVLVPVAA